MLHITAAEYSARTLLLPQLNYLRDAGFSVHLACAPDGAQFAVDTRDFNPVRVNLPRTPRADRLASGLASVVRAVRRIRPDILHLHSPAAALAVRSIPRAFWPDGMRLVYTVHGFAHQWDQPVPPRDRLLERLEFVQSKKTDAMLFQSEEDFDACRTRGYGGRQIKLGNGVDDAWFEVPPRPRSRGPLKVLFVGRLVQEKGVLDLLDALGRTSGIQLTLAGGLLKSERDGVGGAVYDAARSLAGQDRLRAVGHLEQAALRAEMSRNDCLVLPSYREGVPRSIIEAMASSRPVITTDVRGCRELVKHGLNGHVVPPGKPLALARALEELRDLDDASFKSLGDAGRRAADPQLRETAVFGRLVSAYAELGVHPSGVRA